MNKNVKRIFLLTTLLLLLVGVTAVSAVDIDDNNIDEVSTSASAEDNIYI